MRYWSQRATRRGVAETVRLWAHLTACTVSICRLPMYMGMASVLHYAAEASEVFAFLVMLPAACAAARKWTRERRRRGYRARHARLGRSLGPGRQR